MKADALDRFVGSARTIVNFARLMCGGSFEASAFALVAALRNVEYELKKSVSAEDWENYLKARSDLETICSETTERVEQKDQAVAS